MMSIGGLLELLLFPPAGVVWLIIAGLWLWRRRPRWGYALVGSGAAVLFLASLSVVAGGLMSLLEPYPALTPEALKQSNAQAIVVLGAGRHIRAPEYGGSDTLNNRALARVRYGAWLARQTGLPLLVSGGLGEDGQPPEAEMMRRMLEEEYQLPVRWVEPRSSTTYENAKYSAALLKAAGVKRVFLVTNAWHEPRAVWAFNQFQLEVIPAPTAFYGLGRAPLEFNDFMPSARALNYTSVALHEMVGYLWYRIRFHEQQTEQPS